MSNELEPRDTANRMRLAAGVFLESLRPDQRAQAMILAHQLIATGMGDVGKNITVEDFWSLHAAQDTLLYKQGREQYRAAAQGERP